MRHFALTRAAASKEIKAKMKLNATLASLSIQHPLVTPCHAVRFPRKMHLQQKTKCKKQYKTKCARRRGTLDYENMEIEKSNVGPIYLMWQLAKR